MNRKGILYGAGAYMLWGIFPLYFKLLKSVPAVQIIFHRVTWSFLLLAVILTVLREWEPVVQAVRRPKTLISLALAGLLLGTNWLVYVWAVNAGHVVESSLGYFINPLVSVALGVIILRERLRPLQWVPVGLAAIGVLYLVVQQGALLWISLALAFSFGLYGLVKKMSPMASLPGLTVETGSLFLPSIALLIWLETQGTGSFGHLGGRIDLLLMFTGVMTTLPLLMFAGAARSIPLSVVGLLQYVTPTCQFLIGVLVYKEPFTLHQMIGFGIIWTALLIFSTESLLTYRKLQRQVAGKAA